MILNAPAFAVHLIFVLYVLTDIKWVSNQASEICDACSLNELLEDMGQKVSKKKGRTKRSWVRQDCGKMKTEKKGKTKKKRKIAKNKQKHQQWQQRK